MEVRDIHNDMPLAAACQMDVDKFCKDIKSGASAALWALPCDVRVQSLIVPQF